MKILRRMFNLDKLKSLSSELDSAYESVSILKSEVEELKEYKLKYRIAKMYIDDDEALLELLEAEKYKANKPSEYLQLAGYGPRSAAQSAYAGQQALCLAQQRASQAEGMGMAGVVGLERLLQ